MSIVPRSRLVVKLIHCLPCFIVCLLIIGCGGASDSRYPRKSAAMPQMQIAQADAALARGAEAKAAAPGQNPAPGVPRKIISTARVELITDDFDAAKGQIEDLVSQAQLVKLGGFMTQSEINGSIGDQRHALWVIRLPQDKVEPFVQSVIATAELVQSVSGAQDVTDQFVDLTARVKNKQQEEARLLSHLEKSGTLSDTLLLEKELSRVREEVERLQGQLNVLTSATDLATVNVRLQERSRFQPPAKIDHPSFLTAISNAFRGEFRNVVTFLQNAAVLLAAAVPWMIPACIVGIPTYWLMRRIARSEVQKRRV